MMSSIALGLQPSFFWPGSGGGSSNSAGEMNLGTARTARAGGSAVTGGYGDGYLLLNTDHISLHHIGSSNTGMVGHSSALVVASGVSMPQTTRWIVQTGTFIHPSGTSRGVSFTTAFAQPPTFVMISPTGDSNASGSFYCVAASPTTSMFTSFISTKGGTAQVNIRWIAEGQVAL